MNKKDILEACSLDGDVIGLGCEECLFLDECGGWNRRGAGFDCMTRCSSCDPETCDRVCINNDRFVQDYAEIGGFDYYDIGPIAANEVTLLPEYVTTIYDSASREARLREPWVAIPLRALIQRRNGKSSIKFSSKAEMLDALKIGRSAKLLLRGIAEDPLIEEYWAWREESRMAEAIARLEFDLAITPNYSMAFTDTRFQHMANRKRILICAEEWFEAGVSSVPCLQAINDRDFEYWRSFLHDHEEVSLVCQEFSTGFEDANYATPFIERIGSFQESLGRELHFVAVSGFQFRDELRKNFTNWTVVDGNPLFKAHFRQEAEPHEFGVSWTQKQSPKGMPIDGMLRVNIQRVQEAMYTKPRRHSGSNPPPEIPPAEDKNSGQLTLDDIS